MNRRFYAVLIVAAFTVGFFIITPDLVAWWRVDRFKTPLRNEMGDQTHYLTHLHRLQVEGVSGSSMFTWEHRNERSRFLFFETVMKAIPGFASIPIIWWYVILKFFSAIAVFLGIYALFRVGHVAENIALPLALANAFFYNPYAMQGPGLSSWFLLFFLSGLTVFMHAASRHAFSLAALLGSVFFILASGMHAIYVLCAIGMGGLWWLYGITQNKKELRVWCYAFLWLAAAAVCFWTIFGDHLGVFADRSGMAGDSGYLERNGALRIRFLHFPLLTAKLFLLSAALWLGYKKCRESAGLAQRRIWLLLSFLAIPAFFASVQNVFTGLSFIGSHFVVIEELIVIPAAAMVIFISSPEMFQGSRLQKVTGAALLVATGIFAASLAIDRPIRSWLILGRWLPLLGGYLILSCWLLFPRLMPVLRRLATRFLYVFLMLSVSYAGIFLWRSYENDAAAHIAVERYREVFERVSLLPAGVVMSSPDLSELIALFTPQRVYWSRMNGQFGGTYDELAGRLLDEHMVFEDYRLGAGYGEFSIFGGANQWCGKLTEKLFYKKLRESGLTDATTCNTSLRDQDWPKFLDAYAQKKDDVLRGKDWSPRYRLDWLLVDEGRDVVSRELIGRYFEKVESVGSFTVYRYTPKN